MLPTVENDWYVDWLTVPNIDLRADEWQNGINDVLTINNKNYTITGDITLTFWKAMSAMVFHDGLLRDYCDENIYDVVSSGKWTMEYMMNIAQKVPSTGEGTKRALLRRWRSICQMQMRWASRKAAFSASERF